MKLIISCKGKYRCITSKHDVIMHAAKLMDG